MLTDEAEILRRAEAWGRLGRGVAIATVVETSGSAPRPVGSHLVVDEAGVFFGSASGGCVEGEVITAALDVIEDDSPRLLNFGVADEVAWRAGLPCGGGIGVYVQKLDAAWGKLLADMRSEYAARRACALVTPLDGGEPWLLRASDAVDDAFASTLRAGQSALVERQGRRIFAYVHRPPTRLVIVGAVHVAQALASMARVAGFEVVIVDPRAAFTARERFPDTTILTQWPDEALPELGLDASTALTVLSHDPKIDDVALRIALASNCFYVGALGSMTSQRRRTHRLEASGVTSAALARLRAPIGLDIGALSPTEIALAVMGEIVLTQRRKPLRAETARSATP
ncbi:MAG: XdhC family protein [Steroidobacteraceae bacterium]|jgi:xanthine dehydrogenase accessory factor